MKTLEQIKMTEEKDFILTAMRNTYPDWALDCMDKEQVRKIKEIISKLENA